jgi:hypothetical protein
MKIITIGDLHGLDNWKSIDPKRYDRIIFLGDYVDSFFIQDFNIVYNLEEIIRFRIKYPDKVILLLGNHEISYLYSMYRCSGYRPRIAQHILKLLNDHSKLFSLSFQQSNYLWTHAGLQLDYFNKYIQPVVMNSGDGNISSVLNRLYERIFEPLFEVGPERNGEDGNIGGPLWVHSTVLAKSPLNGYHQIVGHTPVRTVTHIKNYPLGNTSVTFCDCIEHGDGSFYELLLSDHKENEIIIYPKKK